MGLSKKLRFEVFKRDSFTCQYCGQSAPDVILHADHIMPASEGGEDAITNLVTSCRDCNLGKSNRLLSDDAVVKQRKRQLDDLQERREQLKLMMDWQNDLLDLAHDAVNELGNLWERLVGGYYLNMDGWSSLYKWIKEYTIQELVEAMRTSTAQYLQYEDSKIRPTAPSVEKAFQYVPRIARMKRKMKDKPYLRELFYIRGILRNRLSYVGPAVIRLMEQAVEAGYTTEYLQHAALEARCWSEFREWVEQWIEEAANGPR